MKKDLDARKRQMDLRIPAARSHSHSFLRQWNQRGYPRRRWCIPILKQNTSLKLLVALACVPMRVPRSARCVGTVNP